MSSARRRSVPILAAALALAALSAPSASAWVCYSTIPYECQVINFARDTAYEATGIFFDATRTENGDGITVEVGVEDLGVHQSATIVVCATDERVGISATSECTGPAMLILS